MDVVAIVPARLASTRLPRKPLSSLGGAPLIARVCQNIHAAAVFGLIAVACDSEEVAEAVRKAGFHAVLTDPALPSGTDRINAAADDLDLRDDSLVVNVQGDEPFIEGSTLKELVGTLQRYSADIATAVVPEAEPSVLTRPSVVKAVLGADQRALYFSRAVLPFQRDAQDGQTHPPRYRHLGLYGFRRDVLAKAAALPSHPLEEAEKLEQLRWLANGMTVRCAVVGEQGFGIDTPEDLARANLRYASTLR